MNLINKLGMKFDSFLPMYNWIYPLSGEPSTRFDSGKASEVFNESFNAKGRALYFHIPFCQTICSFCPFVREGGKGANQYIGDYVNALMKEIELKSRYKSLVDAPVRAIFFGGGTPSLLEPSHIRDIGKTIKKYFDLSQLKEFSFEFEVKSVTPERVEALQQIGVTHARFGLQTFSQKYRKLFNLTATIDQIHRAIEIFTKSFSYTSCDILYGMNGQSEIDLYEDIVAVCNTGIKNIDFYPINNVVTQTNLHKKFRELNLKPTTGLTKHFMKGFIRDVMREHGFLPHNGHGYVKVKNPEIEENPVVSDSYSFVYHEHVYNYTGYDLLGFGVNATSVLNGFTIFNPSSRKAYMASLEGDNLDVLVKEYDPSIDESRPLALVLPYHGKVEKRYINWEQITDDMKNKVQDLKDSDLVLEDEAYFSLTRAGWDWYVNIMYHLLPDKEKKYLTRIINSAYANPARDIESSGLEEFIAHGVV